ncbi:pentapeptide repeat-containing protein [Flavivirga jejuensis]|uniref:Pentapeptide repeat-containing protein n=1 Tax=Flavivirga jejuensis TaxID=870487 RepID=A0ABT8WK54_9FLAO|nr:pentapeptide repeat-containing protein [Flavivirga jejuensis]MDO5973534.1 pentapeptide repeat-containing protein [Flavivirga jejuensis]
MNSGELELYFKSDKSTWFTIDENGNKRWDNDKVEEFWQRIREHKSSDKNLYFTEFVFPEFEHEARLNNGAFHYGNFWSGKKSFNTYVSFSKAKFLGKANFHNVEFSEDVFFGDAEFYEEARFEKSIFLNSLSFGDSVFHKQVKFNLAQFHKQTLFGNCDFLSKTFFIKANFKSSVTFVDTKFIAFVDFVQSTFSGDVFFYRTLFSHLSNFSMVKFDRETTFREVEFRSKVFLSKVIFNSDTLFSDIKINKDSTLVIRECILNNNVVFRRCNMKNFVFHLSDISNTSFLSCNWNVDVRITLKDEEYLLNKEIFEFPSQERFKALENTYRLLKRNFDSNKNWELSGYAYVSEMEMRKKRLLVEKKYYQWFVYCFYDFFGGYTQDFKRPIVSLIGLIGLFSVVYYFIDYNVLKAIQRGIKGALPYIYIDTENPFTGYWLIARNIEFLLGGIFLTFFILALRKRFKQ